MVTAELVPHETQRAQVGAMSSTGNGSPRSIPKAWFCPAAAEAWRRRPL